MHGEITRGALASTGKVPDDASAFERASVVRDGALHGKARVGTKRQGHGNLAGRHIVGGYRSRRKSRAGDDRIAKRWRPLFT